MTKLSCHCGEVEIEVTLRNGLQDLDQCNCSICKRRGAITATVNLEDLSIKKGKEKLKLYRFHTNTAEHYFCSCCGIYTHHKQRTNPNTYGINIGCLENVNPFDLENVSIYDGVNQPCDQN